MEGLEGGGCEEEDIEEEGGGRGKGQREGGLHEGEESGEVVEDGGNGGWMPWSG